jgi:spermidine synthase
MISFSGPWGFIYGSGSGDVAHLEKQDVDRILRAANVSGLKFYSGAVHRALVELTRHYIGLRPASPRIIRDSAPIFIK